VTRPNLIVVVVDRLHSGMLGAYGNSWIRTRRLDRLACQSFLFDQALVDCPQLPTLYRSLWTGIHAAHQPHRPAGASLPELLSAAGWNTALITDSAEVAVLGEAGAFRHRQAIEQSVDVATAPSVAETRTGQLLATALDWLRQAPQPFALWLHCQAMAGPWDAPLELRNQYAEEDDPEPPALVLPPEQWLDADVDPDELLGITQAYAGEISALDASLGQFLDSLEELQLASSTQLTMLSARGYPLGEHRRAGACDEALYGEVAQLAWLMRFPDELGRLARSQALVQPADLPGTLLDWLGLDRGSLAAGHASTLLPLLRGETFAHADRAVMLSRNDQGLRTPAWYLRAPGEGPAELYAKPSDRWEVNEVSRLAPEVVASMQAALAEFPQAGESGSLSPLPDQLVVEVD
jgi:arylsulfatase A-like enzyme